MVTTVSELSVSVDSVVAGSVAGAGEASCAEKLEGNRSLQERCLPIVDRARLTVVKLRLLALGAVLTVFGKKILVRRARVRDDSASAG